MDKYDNVRYLLRKMTSSEIEKTFGDYVYTLAQIDVLSFETTEEVYDKYMDELKSSNPSNVIRGLIEEGILDGFLQSLEEEGK